MSLIRVVVNVVTPDKNKAMPTLDFKGKAFIYTHHLSVPFRELSNDAALTEQLVEKMLASNKDKKRLLVFAAAKFMAQKELTRQGVEFCQLPHAIHRILGD